MNTFIRRILTNKPVGDTSQNGLASNSVHVTRRLYPLGLTERPGTWEKPQYVPRGLGGLDLPLSLPGITAKSIGSREKTQLEPRRLLQRGHEEW